MKKLIIHIGYPKTATTSLQLNLFSGLKDLGKIEYLNHLTNNPEYIGNIKIRKLYEYLVGYTDKYDVDENKLLFSKIDMEISVISAETLSILYPGISFTHLTGNAKNNTKKMKDVFSEYFDKIEIIMSIRAQTQIIPRCYKQWYYTIVGEDSNYNDISKWVSENFLENRNVESLLFNYELMYKSYFDVFGKENVHLFLYEDLKNDKDYYYYSLAKIFNVDKILIKKYLERNVVNKSVILEDGSIKTERPTLSFLLTSKLKNNIREYLGENIFNISKKIYKNSIPDSLKGIKIGKEKIVNKLNDEESEKIFERYKEPNRRLAEIAGLDVNKMKEYKYF
jgi:hypothetical protein